MASLCNAKCANCYGQWGQRPYPNQYGTDAGSWQQAYPNLNHSYMMMRDLEASDDINQRWAGARNAQIGKYYGYFIEQISTPSTETATPAVPAIAGTYAAGQTLTVTLLTPYRHLTTGHAWYNGSGTKLQDGGATYALGASPPASVTVRQFLTDAFGRRIDVASRAVAA